MEPKMVQPDEARDISLYDVHFRYGIGARESEGALSMQAAIPSPPSARRCAPRSISAMEKAMPSSPLGDWSAWLPLAISAFLLVLLVRHVVLYGTAAQADEGTEAHLFQLLMPVQLMVMAYFAVSSLPRAPRLTLMVLALQGAAAGLLFAAVYWLEHMASVG